MQYIENNDYWLMPLILVLMAFSIIWLYIEYRVKEAKNEYARQLIRHGKLKGEIAKINLLLLENGMSYTEILKLWEETMTDAQISYNLPPCGCDDVNECDTWCQAKARFKMYPPE